jgi:hypothetical protein
MADPIIAIFEPADRITGRCTATVRAGRCVAISADIPGGPFGTENIRIAEAGAGVKPVGVAITDGIINDEIPLHTDHSVVPCVSGAAVTAGVEVMSDAQGRVIPWVSAASEANKKVGLAFNTVAGADLPIAVKLYS